VINHFNSFLLFFPFSSYCGQMPKSKRNRLVSLTSTKKKSFSEIKEKLVQKVRDSCDEFERAFIFSVQNMRNSKLKDVRQQWKDSRFFFGKNKVMAIGLGMSKETEYKDNLHKLSDRLYGQCGLLFTNRPRNEVLKWFEEYYETDFARSGNIASETIVLDAGPLTQFAHSIEPHLRLLGMPTSLQKGVVTLLKDYEVCKEGTPLTSEQARILKLLGNEMAEFKITIEAVWESDGYFEEYIPIVRPEIDVKERETKKRKLRKNKRISAKKEEMSEDDDNIDDDLMSDDEENSD